MEFNFAKKQVARISRNKIFLVLIVAVAAAATVAAFAPSPGNLFLEYASFVTSEDAEKLIAEEKNYASTTAELLFDTGYESTESGLTKDKYYAFWAGEKYIVCKVDRGFSQEEYENYQLSGKLDYAAETDREVIEALRGDLAEYMDSEMLASYILDTKASRLGTQIVVGIGVLIVVIAIINLFSAIISLTDYKKNKYFKKMGTDVDDSERVNQAISGLYSRGTVPKKVSSMDIFGEWLIDYAFIGFTISKKDDIIWIYKTITKHRTNGIPTRKSYEIMIKGKNDVDLCINAKNAKNADEMMEELYAEIPYAIMGYSDELSELYTKNKEEFIKLQVQHRQEMEG